MFHKPKDTSAGGLRATLPCKSIWSNSKALPSHSGLPEPRSFGEPAVIFCFGCQTTVPISDKNLEDVVIFLTSSKPGNFISPKDLTDCQKQWLDMKKRQSRESRRGERRALGWEGVSAQTGSAKAGPEYGFRRPLSARAGRPEGASQGKTGRSGGCAIPQSAQLQETVFPIFLVGTRV